MPDPLVFKGPGWQALGARKSLAWLSRRLTFLRSRVARPPLPSHRDGGREWHVLDSKAICLVPVIFLQATSRSYPISTGLGLAVFILGEVLCLSIAVAIARRFSSSKRLPTRGTVPA